MNDSLELYRLKSQISKNIIMFLIASLFFGFGAFKSFEAGNVLIGGVLAFLCILFSFAIITDGVEYFSETDPRIIIDQNGIEVIHWTCGLIPWEEISTVSTRESRIKHSTLKQLILEVKFPHKFRQKTRKNFIQKITGEIETSITEVDNQIALMINDDYNVNFDEVWQHIQMLKNVYRIPTSVQSN